MLEEKIQPTLKKQIQSIGQHIAEWEREGYDRLKRFKEVPRA